MALIYFLRHGQTGWNAERRVQGHTDVALNDTGREQAARNGRALSAIMDDPATFDYVSSPLCRATETMEIVRGGLGLEPKGYRTDDRLREIHLGDWQGHRFPDIERAFPEQVQQRRRDGWNFLHPGEGAESYALLSARVLECVSEIMTDTVMTAHGGVLRCLRRHYEGLDNAATFRLEVPQDKVLRIADGQLTWI
jgi:probable phosphoglycerate mutase